MGVFKQSEIAESENEREWKEVGKFSQDWPYEPNHEDAEGWALAVED